jgi:DNA (cytosine-5)-methyltransferase 1
VKGLLRPSFRAYYDYLLRELAAPYERPADGEDWRDHDDRLRKPLRGRPADPAERYTVSFHLVNAADYGVPQIRWRVFVVAFRSDLCRHGWVFPAPTHAAAALARSQAAGRYWDRHRLARRGAVQAVAADGDDGLAPWRTLRDAIAGLPAPSRDQKDDGRWPHHRLWPGARVYPGHTPNDLDRPAKTVKAGVHGVPGGETVVRLDDSSIRYLTVREVARVMTFPDDWWLAGPRGEQMRQLGNAVPPVLGQVVARSVARELAPSATPVERSAGAAR